MPYGSLKALPESVKRVLPRRAQEIFRAAFNRVIARARGAGSAVERRAFRIAWAAVKHGFKKTPAGRWVKRS